MMVGCSIAMGRGRGGGVGKGGEGGLVGCSISILTDAVGTCAQRKCFPENDSCKLVVCVFVNLHFLQDILDK